jgi:glycosyltransferase involved in cell wall biosynthesis
MSRLGVFVGENNWTFFHEIYEDLAQHYSTEIFRRKTYQVPILQGRLNRWAFHHGLRSTLARNDVCFFEWASELLMASSRMPKSCAIATRLHSFELYDWAPKIHWQSVDRIICVSQAMQKRFIALYPDHAPKTAVVYNGRPLDAFQHLARRDFQFNLGMLGSIIPIKRVYDVILMFYTLKQQARQARLFLGGEIIHEPRYAAATCRLVEKLGLQDSVLFDGRVDPALWLQKIDILISNSYWEGQQVALIEGMASGCYCLCHFWAGAEEMLPPENLYITEAEFCQKILSYAETSAAEKRQCQARLRAIAYDKFDIERIKPQIRQIINELAH